MGTSISAAQGRLGDADGHIQENVIAVALEQPVRLDADGDVQIARRASAHTGFALAALDQAHAVLNAGGDTQLQAAFAPHTTGAATGLTTVLDDLALAVTGGTGTDRDHEAAARAHLTRAFTGGAGLGLGTGLGARTAARIAVFVAEEIDRLFAAESRLLEGDGDAVLQVIALDRTGPPRTAAHAAKEGIKDAFKAAMPPKPLKSNPPAPPLPPPICGPSKPNWS